MRISILRADLPANYNKVAKYMGRHWPTGKLPHNKSRESLALLLGYNSYYELDQVADKQVLPNQVQLKKIVSSMVVRAMIHCDISLDAASSLFNKLPLKELSIYKVTDKFIEENFIREQNKADSKFHHLYMDEAHLLFSYKSPKTLIDQYHQGFIPPYSYAVKKNGLIFSSSRYESLIEKVGDIEDDILESEGISRQEFIEKYIMPKAWLPVHEYLYEKDASGLFTWRTPHQVQVYKSHKGYLLYNASLEAFYPNVFPDFNSVSTALEKLYLGKPIEEVNPLSGKIENWWLGMNVESDYKGFTQVSDFDQYSKVSFYGQILYLTNQYSTLGDFGAIPSLSDFELMSGGIDYQIPAEFIDPTVLVEYSSLFKTLPFIRKRIERKVKTLDVDELKRAFLKLASLNLMTVDEAVKFINEDEGCSVEEIEHAFELGGKVAAKYPEVSGLIDQTYLGYSYQLFIQDEYYNSRSIMIWDCEDRLPEFLVFLFLTLLGAVKLHEHQSYVFIAGGALLTHYMQDFISEKFEVDELVREFKTIKLLQKKFRQRWERLQRVGDYCKFLSSQDEQYLSNGTPSPYKEESGNERFTNMMSMYRKYSS